MKKYFAIFTLFLISFQANSANLSKAELAGRCHGNAATVTFLAEERGDRKTLHVANALRWRLGELSNSYRGNQKAWDEFSRGNNLTFSYNGTGRISAPERIQLLNTCLKAGY